MVPIKENLDLERIRGRANVLQESTGSSIYGKAVKVPNGYHEHRPKTISKPCVDININ